MTARRVLLALPFVLAAALGAGVTYLAWVIEQIDRAEDARAE